MDVVTTVRYVKSDKRAGGQAPIFRVALQKEGVWRSEIIVR
uniref:Uncharacterized protein n=1 Tax=Yersinia pestis Java 9 TaxID=880632 RepID=E8PS89_YERPE|nr:hypothetical protein YPJ_pJARS3537 [Yersinia pestis Java 9]